jgi:hypothetical protein
MKLASQILAASIVVIFASIPGNAALIATDSFLTTTTGAGSTYNSTTDSGRLWGLNPTAGTSGFSAAWGTTNGTQTADLRAQVGGLTHPFVVNPAGANDGSAFATNGSSTRTITRPFAVFSRTEPQYFMSALLRTESMPTVTNPAAIGFGGPFNHDVAPTNGLQIGIDDGEIRLYHRNTAGTYVSAGTLVTSGIQASMTYQLIVQIDANSSAVGDELFTASVYDSTGLQVGSSVSIQGSLDIAGTEFERMLLHKRDLTAYANIANTPRFDEFRFGTALSDVSAVPEPGGYAMMIVTALGWLCVRRSRVA